LSQNEPFAGPRQAIIRFIFVASGANPSIGIQTLAGRFGVHFSGWIPFASFAVLIHKTITWL
jgi:hypothetical protein